MMAFDMIIIGAGMAGATVAGQLAAAGRRVALIEAESQPGYHTTGRSAAIWIQNYGGPDVRILTGASRGFFETPGPGFSDHPLVHRRAIITVAPEDQAEHLTRIIADGHGMREISVAEARRLVPILRADYPVMASIEEDGFDIDVHAVHQGFLRQVRAHGGQVLTDARAIARREGVWHVTAAEHVLSAPILVNAAGSWADEVAVMAGVRPVGLVPMRRTAVLVDAPEGHDPANWPMIGDADHSWYSRPEARRKLMLSPADETPMHPHDVQPDELDMAIAIDRVQAALDLPVKRIEHSWAGLRTFAPDRSLVIGWAPDAPGFLWMAGQGGYGIQTAPAAGRLATLIALDRDLGDLAGAARMTDPARFAVRQPAEAPSAATAT